MYVYLKKVRKTMSIFLAAVVLLAAVPLAGFVGIADTTQAFTVQASAAERVASGTCGDGVAWTLDSDGLLSVFGDGEMDNFAILAPALWYEYAESIQRVVIEDGVTSVGEFAFFLFYDNLTEVEIADSVTRVGGFAFSACEALAEVSFGENSQLTEIDAAAFFDCASLSKITIPAGVSAIEGDSFQACVSMTEIQVDADNAYYTSVDGVLFSKDKKTLLCYPAGKAGTSYVIEDTVTAIGECAFSSCVYLESLTVPDSVKSIGDDAFLDSAALAEIILPAQIENLGDGAFEGTAFFSDAANRTDGILYVDDYLIDAEDTLTGICTVKASTKKICADAFSGCTALEGIVIPKSVTKIGDSAFDSCEALASVTFEEGSQLTDIGESAFSGCTALTGIAIPESVKTIGSYAFYHCDALTGITFGENSQLTSIEEGTFWYCALTDIAIPDSVTSIGYRAFDMCDFECITFGENSKLTSIGEIAFNYCNSLKSITIPASVTQIDPRAFQACSSLEDITVEEANTHYSSVDGVLYNKNKTLLVRYPAGRAVGDFEIPETVTAIGASSFASAHLLTSFTIPENVISIEPRAFDGCTSLDWIIVLNPLCALGSNCLPSKTEIWAPADSLAQAYAQSNGHTFVEWNGEFEIPTNTIAFGSCLDDLFWILKQDGMLTIKGTGAMHSTSTAPWDAYKTKIKSVYIEGGVTSIPVNAFNGCTYLQSFIVADDNANYSSLDGVLYNKDKTVLVRHPQGKKNTSFAFHPSVTAIGDYAFYGCTVCTFIEEEDFGYMTIAVYCLDIPYTVTRVGQYALGGLGYSGADGLGIFFYNPDCEIYDAASTIKSGQLVILSGYTGSTAETYANKYERTFNSIGEMPADHTPSGIVRENEVPATCENNGSYDLVSYCSTCGEELARMTLTESALGHSFAVYVQTLAPDCKNTGLEVASCTRGCGKTHERTIPALGHAQVVTPGVAPTCTETGLTEGKKCSVCGEILAVQEEIPALGHTEEIIPAVAATCTETGLTEGKKCSVCGEILAAQEEVPALGHTEEIIPAVAPTCTETGLTEGKKCSVCGEILAAQEEVPALGHKEEIIPAVAPTCTETGLTEGKKCSVCGEILVAQEEVAALGHSFTDYEQILAPDFENPGIEKAECDHGCGATDERTVPALKHTEEIIPAVAPTCTETGLTEGKKCSVCGEILAAQEEVPALGHTEEIIPAVAATCTETGLTEGKKCSVCGEVLLAQEEVPVLAHTEESIPAVAPTCNETGLTEGKKCSVCGEVLVAQEEVPVLAHTEESIPAVAPSCTATGLTEGKKCTVCGEILVAQEVTPVTDHTDTDKDGLCDNCNTSLAPVLALGDIDGDGEITSSDARLALRAAVKLETLTDAQVKAADADGDGKLTSSDARLILRAAVGLEEL